MDSMKSSPLIGLALLGIGIAVGWFSRGALEKTVATVVTGHVDTPQKVLQAEITADAEKETLPRGKSAIRETKSESAQGVEEIKVSEVAGSHMRKMMESMAQRQRTRLDLHVDRLHASLSLSQDQRLKLTAWLDENTKSAGDYDMMAMSGDPKKAYEAQNAFSPEGLEEYLAGMLAPEQKGALAEFQQRDKQGKVDALALKNLSQIQKVVDFGDGQRDQVYQILSEAAERKLSEAPKTEKMMSFMHESMGIETDPYDLGVDTLMQSMMGDPETMDVNALKDTKAMVQNLRDELARRIDQKVELLQPVLNEKQLEQYRTELRTRGGGFVDQMIMGLEMMGKKDDPTIIISEENK